MSPLFSELAQLVTALAAFGALVVSILNRGKIHQVHLSLNSRLSQLIDATRAAAHLAGKEEERAQEIERKNGNGNH